MKKIKIEEVGDITSKYRYLEVFYLASNEMFLRILITDDKKLAFNFFPTNDGILLEFEEMSFIINSAQSFLPRAIKDEEDFDEWVNKS